MNGRVLLDTNIIIALFSGDIPVTEKLSHLTAVFIPSIAIGELYFGARKSARFKTNTAKIDEFCSNSIILPADEETARHYGKIRSIFAQKAGQFPKTTFG